MNEWLQNKWILRFISLTIAFAMWLFVNDASMLFPSDPYQTKIRDVAIQVDYDVDRYELIQFTKKANILLWGDKYVLEHLPPTYRVYIDLTKLGSGLHRIPVKVSGLPKGTKAKVEPSTIRAKLEEKIQREMPIEIQFIGELSQGYKVGVPSINQKKALIRGSDSNLQQVKSIKAVISLDGVSSSIRKLVKLQAYGENGPIGQVNIYPEVVNVEVPIQSPSKVVPLKIGIREGPPDGFAIEHIDMSVSKVRIYGPKSYVDSLQYYTGPQIDLAHTTESITILKEIPFNGPVSKVEPKIASIYVKIVPATTKTIEKVPIQITGVSPGMKITFTTPSSGKLDLKLSGAPKFLEQIDINDIHASIDGFNFPAGSHYIPIRLKLPPYIKLLGQQNLNARVQITP